MSNYHHVRKYVTVWFNMDESYMHHVLVIASLRYWPKEDYYSFLFNGKWYRCRHNVHHQEIRCTIDLKSRLKVFTDDELIDELQARINKLKERIIELTPKDDPVAIVQRIANTH